MIYDVSLGVTDYVTLNHERDKQITRQAIHDMGQSCVVLPRSYALYTNVHSSTWNTYILSAHNFFHKH